MEPANTRMTARGTPVHFGVMERRTRVPRIRPRLNFTLATSLRSGAVGILSHTYLLVFASGRPHQHSHCPELNSGIQSRSSEARESKQLSKGSRTQAKLFSNTFHNPSKSTEALEYVNTKQCVLLVLCSRPIVLWSVLTAHTQRVGVPKSRRHPRA
jgi:hypothetical protein